MADKKLTLGSLFDGSGGFPLGGMIAGIEPVWSSEIEPFPILVTYKRMPQVRHYGDVSSLNGSELEPVDIITFGSPCQDLSIAGKRAGIQDGERSNLFFQAIRIIKEMREATDGKYPRYCVWENVPGAFSSNKGEDFRAVLTAVVGVKEEGIEVPAPENKRWAKSDILLGRGWSVAYRVLDAQYWGVAQRRARIYLVADFNGESAGEVLFKSEGVSGYTPQGFRSWQGTAGGAEEGSGAAGERSDDRDGRTLCVNTQGQSGVSVTEGYSGTLIAQDHGNHPAVMQETPKAAGFSMEHSAQSRSIGYEEEVSPTLRAGAVPAAMELYENHSQDTRFNGPLDVAQPVTANYGMGGNNQPLVVENHPADGRVDVRDDGKSQTLTRRMGTGGGNVPLVAEPNPVTLKIRSGCEGGGKGALWQEDKSATLGTHNDQTLFQPVDGAIGFDRYNGAVTGDVAHTLDTGGGNTKPMVFEPDHKAYGIAKEAYSSGEKANFNFTVTEEKAPTLQTREPHAVAAPEMKAYGVCSKSSHSMLSDNPHSGFYEAETSRTLDAHGGNPTCNQGGICIVAPALDETQTYDVRFTSDGSRVTRGHVYETETARTLSTDKPDPAGNQGGIAFLEKADGGTVAVEGNGARPSHKGDGYKETDTMYTLNTTEVHAVAFAEKEDAPVYHSSKNSHHTKFTDEPMTDTLVATDYKDPPTVCEEPMYIVRRLTPTECARLQGFPDWWCSGLSIEDPTEEQMEFWIGVWDTWNTINGKKPKTDRQIRRWLADPYTDAAEYKLWGNGVALPCCYFVLSGIAWAAADA